MKLDKPSKTAIELDYICKGEPTHLFLGVESHLNDPACTFRGVKNYHAMLTLTITTRVWLGRDSGSTVRLASC